MKISEDIGWPMERLLRQRRPRGFIWYDIDGSWKGRSRGLEEIGN